MKAILVLVLALLIAEFSSVLAQPARPGGDRDLVRRGGGIEASRPGRIEGSVTDASGKPLAGAIVRLEQDGWEIAHTNTSPPGTYQLAVEPADKPYSLSVRQTDFVPVRTNVLVSARATLKADFALQDDTSILGTVLALDNSPIEAVAVQAVRLDTTVAADARPDLHSAPVQPGLMGEYFQSDAPVSEFPRPGMLASPTLRRVDRSINFVSAPDPLGGTDLSDHFYVRWTGLLRIAKAGDYTFFMLADDGVRLILDGKEVLNNGARWNKEESGSAFLEAGDHPLVIDYYEIAGNSGCQLWWQSGGNAKEIVPEEVLFHHHASWPPHPPGPVIQPDSVTTDWTNAKGAFRVRRLPAGRYQVRCQVEGGFRYFGTERLVSGSVMDQALQVPDAQILEIEFGERAQAADFHVVPFKTGRWQRFNSVDGMASSYPAEILRDFDGTLWFATSIGLSRFDGHRFERFVDRILNLQTVHRAPDGTMWVGAGEGLFRFDGRRYGRLPLPSEMDGAEVLALASDPQGVLWVGTYGAGLTRYNGTRFLAFEPGLFSEKEIIHVLSRDSIGRMWVGTGSGLYCYDAQRQKEPGVPRGKSSWDHFTKADGLPHNSVLSISEAPNGAIWVGTRDGIARYDGTNFVSFTRKHGMAPNRVEAIHADPAGVIWIGSQQSEGAGMSRFDGKTFVNFTTGDGLPLMDVSSFVSGPDGALWVATYGGGIGRYDTQSGFLSTPRNAGLATRSGWAVLPDRDGTIWFGTGWYDGKGGVLRYDGQRALDFGARVGLPNGLFSAVLRDGQGALWFANYVNGAYRYDGTNLTHHFEGKWVVRILSEPDGTLWFGVNNAVVRFDGHKFLEVGPENDPKHQVVWQIHRAPDGVLWAAIGDHRKSIGRLARFDGQRFTYVSADDPLARIPAISIASSADGTLWAGGVSGLWRYRTNELVHFTTADGLPQPQVESLFVSRDGTVWCGTCAGVARYDGTCFQTLDSRDGLAGNQQVLVIAEGREGEMWFGCKDGISSFRANNVAPVCRIVGVQTDKDFTDLPTLPRFTVGTRLTLKFDSLDFKTVPEKRLYRCRILEGAHSVDELGSGGESPRQEGWLPARHDTRFEFTPPKAGIYTFAVQAIDRDLNYSKPVAATLTIVPPWYLNAKIAGPIAAGNLGLIVWAFVARLLYRAKRREAERLKEQMLAQEHEAREALEAKNAQLESAKVAVEAKAAQLVESNTQLAAAKDAADSANKAKSLFLANMSHEIRTPMNAILGYSQILRRDAELPPKYRASIETIEKSGDHLLAMINDILDLSKIEAGRMELQESDFDLGSLVQGLAEMFRVRCEEKQLELRVEWGSAECGVRSAESESRFATHVEGEKGGKGEEGHGQEGHVPALSPSPFPPFPPAPLAVRGDEGKLRQVLINLLGNAVKFTERGSVVLRLESRLQPVGASDTLTGQQGCGETHAADRLKAGLRTYCFEVIDTGKGISPENLRDLFQPFQQGAEGRKKGGTGLGLAITKRQVELMGGTIGVESEVGQGSRFFFEIPLAPAQGEIVARTEKPTREVRGFKAGTRVRALVVDDVRQNREVLSQMLTGIGCEVTLAEDGTSALARLRVQMPEIVFSDIRMPDMDGTEVVRRVFAERGRGCTKFVAISASVFAHEQQSYLDAGFDAFLGKPFRFEELCDCLQRLLHVEFDYADEEEKVAPAPAALDPATVTLPEAVLTQLREAAARYSVTRLEKGLADLEQNGDVGREVAAYLRGLVQRGDLDGVSEFLGKVKAG